MLRFQKLKIVNICAFTVRRQIKKQAFLQKPAFLNSYGVEIFL